MEDDPEFEQAIEYDLIALGLRLRWLCDGTDRLNWRDLLVIVRESGRDTAAFRQAHGEHAEWGMGEYLLASILDTLNAANWQRAGDKRKPKPDPVPRPGEGQAQGAQPAEKKAGEQAKQLFASDGFEPDAVSLDEINKWLGVTPASR